MNTTKEKITEAADGWWTCNCGNSAVKSGFYPSDSSGREVDPIPGEWGGKLYVCFQCGRVIDQTTLEVVMYSK